MIRVTSLCAVAAFLFVLPTVHGDATADDWKKLIGNWKVETATLNGADATTGLKSFVLTIEEGKYKLDFGGMTDAGTLTLEPGKKPKLITITGADGPNKGKTIPAMYVVDGDSLKICYTIDGKEPPREFRSTAENKTLLVNYKRDKK